MGQITYNRGTTYNITFNYQKDGVPSNDAIAVIFTIKTNADDDSTDSAALVQKVISMSGSSVNILLSPSDIADSYPDGKYVYDLKVVESWGSPPTVPPVIYLGDSGKFTLDVTATNRITS